MKNHRRRGAPRLGKEAWEQVSRIRALPRRKAAFTLMAATDSTSRGLTVVDNGSGPDSKYYAILSEDGSVPAWAQPMNAYVARTEAELAQILGMFADHPELFSRPRGDLLDEAYTVPFDDETDSWEAAEEGR